MRNDRNVARRSLEAAGDAAHAANVDGRPRFWRFGIGGSIYDRALAMPLANEPGSTFTYTGISLQVFGAVFAQKLRALDMTPQSTSRARLTAGKRRHRHVAHVIRRDAAAADRRCR